jgi:hypothetical protein
VAPVDLTATTQTAPTWAQLGHRKRRNCQPGAGAGSVIAPTRRRDLQSARKAPSRRLRKACQPRGQGVSPDCAGPSRVRTCGQRIKSDQRRLTPVAGRAPIALPNAAVARTHAIGPPKGPDEDQRSRGLIRCPAVDWDRMTSGAPVLCARRSPPETALCGASASRRCGRPSAGTSHAEAASPRSSSAWPTRPGAGRPPPDRRGSDWIRPSPGDRMPPA